MKKKRTLVISFIIISISCVITYLGFVINEFNNTQLEFSKEYYEISVNNSQSADYTIFVSPTGRYTSLNAIDQKTRIQIAEYMKKNNLVLKSGIHKFHRINYTKDILIQDFQFIRCHE